MLLESDPVDDAPILDLRIRKGVRRHGVRVAVASARPTALDPRADAVLRTAPSGGAALLVALDAALTDDAGDLGGAASAAGSSADAVSAFAEALTAAGEDIVIVYGERLLVGPAAATSRRARCSTSPRGSASPAARAPACSRSRPARTAAACARPASPAATGRATRRSPSPAGGADAIAQGLADGDLHTLYLLHADPLRTHPDRALWEQALGTAQTVIAHESVLTETVREYADVVFPAEAYAEKEGTLVHPDGRVQRLRAAIGRAKGATQGGGVRAGWQVIADVARARRPRPRRRRRPDGLAPAVRGRPVLRGPDARPDRRPRRALARARVGRELRGRRRGSRSR